MAESPPIAAQPFEPGQVSASPLGHKLMFLGLSTMAFALFAPTVVLPVLREYTAILAEEKRLEAQVAALEAEVAHREELAYAFENDAIINERLAMLDLRYQKPNEVVIPILNDDDLIPPEPQARPADAFDVAAAPGGLSLPRDWPAWTLKVEAWAAGNGLIDLFLDAGLRPVFLLMSGGLVIAAFVLFAPRVQHGGPTPSASAA